MLAVFVTMVPLLASAQLGSNQTLVTNVPFQFRVSDKLIPAGKCTVQRASASTNLLIIRNYAGNVGMFSKPLVDEGKQASTINALVFNKYGDHYFLTSIRLAGSETMYKIPEGRQEAELRAQNMPASQETLLALLQ
jgi:hypothetical protein